ESHVRLDEHDAQRGWDRESIAVERIDGANQQNAAQQCRSDVVDVMAGKRSLRDVCRSEYLELSQRTAEQSIRRDRTRDRRSGAATLSPGQRKALRDMERDAGRHATRPSNDFACGDRGGVSARVIWQVGVTRVLQMKARGVDEPCLDRVAEAGHGA